MNRGRRRQPGGQPVGGGVGGDAADRNETGAGRQNGAPGLEHGRRHLLGGEHLQQGGAAGQRLEGFARRRHADDRFEPVPVGGGDDVGIEIGGDDVAAAERRKAGDVAPVHHGAGTDQHAGQRQRGEPGNRFGRAGAVERHLDQPNSGLPQGLADACRFAGVEPAKNGDDGGIGENGA